MLLYKFNMKPHNHNDLNFAQAATAIGMDPTQFSQLLKSRGFRKRRSGYRNEHLISREEIALLFNRVLTDAEFERARKVKSKITGKAEKEAALGVMLRQTLAAWTPYDPGYARAAVEARDTEWQNRLLAKDIQIATPPMPAKLVPDLSSHFIFSREAVEILIANAVREHHADWFQWKLDPVARAQFPDGPKLNTGEMT